MDALKFIEASRRMCKSFGNTCNGCPANVDDDRCKFSIFGGDEAAEQIKLLEEWSAAHPRRTRQSVFLEQYPEAMIDGKDMFSVCPQYIDRNLECRREREGDCGDCRREFWMQEVE